MQEPGTGKRGTKVCSIGRIDFGLHSAAEVFDDATKCQELVHGSRPGLRLWEQWLICYVQDTNQGLDKLIDCCIENKNRRTHGIYTGRTTFGICGFVGATILGYMTTNNMTNNTREHD